ncbi:hypothetical protein H6P81_006325 [Aristolochia fimbriata]|uniref:Uncharacterized protein n=1 Tax=Aristolochia fimbriata TaxID=158543 RepID=A0AAV7F0P7_ARIFI|nr:hypothetical protein H6P81_006325 [Aristolochia fimbriata]
MGFLPGGQPRPGTGPSPEDPARMARLLPLPLGPEEGLRQLSQDVRRVRQPPRRRQGRHPRLGRLLLPSLPSALPQGPPKVACLSLRLQGGGGGVQQGGGETWGEADEASVGEPGFGGVPAEGLRRGRRRRLFASEFLPKVSTAGSHTRTLPALRSRRTHHSASRRTSPGPSGPPTVRFRQLDHRPPRSQRLYREHRRPNTGVEQCNVQERGAPSGGELVRGEALTGLILQPKERHSTGAGAATRDARPTCLVPAHDLRQLPSLHQNERATRQGCHRILED